MELMTKEKFLIGIGALHLGTGKGADFYNQKSPVLSLDEVYASYIRATTGTTLPSDWRDAEPDGPSDAFGLVKWVAYSKSDPRWTKIYYQTDADSKNTPADELDWVIDHYQFDADMTT